MALVTWDSGGDGTSWSDPLNWSSDALPGSIDDVTIDVGGSITHANGDDSINSLTSSRPIFISGGTLDVLTTASISSNLSIAGGTLKHATVTASDGASLLLPTFSSGTLDDVTLKTDVTMGQRSQLTVRNGLVLNGSLMMLSGGSGGARVDFVGTQTFSTTSAGEIVFVVTPLDSLAANVVSAKGDGGSSPATLTLGQGVTVHGAAAVETIGGYIRGTIINQGTIAADAAGSWVRVFADVTNEGTMKASGGGRLDLNDAWSSAAGTLAVDNGTLDLGGTFTTAAVGTFNRNGGTVNVTGILDNTGSTLTLDASTGSWNLDGGTILGGVVTTADGAALVSTYSGTLDGVTLASDMTVTDAQLWVRNGLTLDSSTLTVGPAAGEFFGELDFFGVNTLGGDGTLVLRRNDDGLYGGVYNEGDVTVGPDVTVRGSGAWFGEGAIINQGTVTSDVTGHEFIIESSTLLNRGTLAAQNGGALYLRPSNTIINNPGGLRSSLDGTIVVFGNLAGDTENVALYKVAGTLGMGLGGEDSNGELRLLEAMSRDAGSAPSSFTNNFAYGTIAVGQGSYIRLVDQSDNAPGTDSEAVYANALIVPVGSTLDLDGLNFYARSAQIDGTILNGAINLVPESGTISLNNPPPGTISVSGEVDEWQFYGFGGRSIGIRVNPGTDPPIPPVSPTLAWAQVQLLDSDNQVLATATSASSGAIAAINDLVLPYSGTYKIQVRASTDHSSSTGNYTVAAWDATPDVFSLNLHQQAIGSIETPFATDRWNFSATAGQQIRFDLINTSAVGLTFTLTGPNGYTTNLTDDAGSITLPTSGNFTLTVLGPTGQTGNYAFKLLDATQIDLLINSFAVGTLSGTGQAYTYRLEVAAAKPLLVRLDDSTNSDRNELYLSFGKPPTRANYDYRFSMANSSDQAILVPNATPGTWYVLVYGTSAPSPSEFTLSATSSDIRISKVSPERYGTNNTVTMTVTGAGFDNPTQISLIAADNTSYAAAAVAVDSFNQITATFNLQNVSVGVYSIRVTGPGGDSDTLTNAFTVTAAGAPKLETHLILPSSFGRHADATIYVEYANTGTVAMPAPLLLLQSADPDDSDRPIFTLDHSRIIQSFWSSALPDGTSNSSQILASGATVGVLQPGESVRVPVYYLGLQEPWSFSDTLVELELRTFTTSDSTTIDWNSLKSSLKPPDMSDAAWNRVFSNIAVQTGNTWGDYVRMLDDNATYLGRLGQNVTDIGRLWQFEIRQANDLGPLGQLASTLDAGVPTPGLPLAWGRGYSPTIGGRFVMGPFGLGWSAPWQTSLAVDPDGSVTVTTTTGFLRRFQPDSRTIGVYFSQAGDHAVLTSSGGTYTLRDSDGTVSHFLANGKLDYLADTNGNRITAGYSAGKLTSLTHSSGQSLIIAYNAAGLVNNVTDSYGRQVLYTYDGANKHLMAVRGYDGLVTHYTYDTTSDAATENALLSVEYADGTHTFYGYDFEGRLAGTNADSNAQRLDFSYDSAGKVTVTDASGSASLFYNEQGLLAKMQDQLGRPVYFNYDTAFNTTRVTDGLGGFQIATYDANGNPLTLTNRLGNVTRFTYNSLNRLTSITDARGNITRYNYDAAGNLTSINYPDNSVEQFSIDALGQPQYTINRRGQTIGYQYNSTGQVIKQTFANGSHVDFVYDAHGNLTSATDSSGTTTNQYDSADRLTKVNYPSGRFLIYGYDAAGRRIQMKDDAGFETNYEYDTVGRLKRLFDANGATIASYSYDANGRLTRKDEGNGTYTTYDYDAAGQLLHLVNYAPDGSVNSRFDYTYDRLGRRITEGTIDGVWTYSYDGSGQLTHAVFASTNLAVPSQDLTYVYDAMGNRIQTIQNGVTTNYATNNLNEYTTVGATNYTYDRDGNLISKTDASGTTTYGYDAMNRLVSVVSPTGTWTYEYDALGNRIATIHNGQRTDYLLDPTGLVNIVGEYDGGGNLVSRYTYGLGLTSRVDAAGAAGYYDFDAIGSTAGLTNASGSYSNEYVYLPFGENLISNENIANTFEFVGQFGVMNEGNGLHFMRARFYNSGIGRFESVDPLKGTDIYTYADNRPIASIDPSGLVTWSWGQTGQLVGGLVQIVSGTVGVGIGLVAIADTAGVASIPGAYTIVVGATSVIAGLTNVVNAVQNNHINDVPGGPAQAVTHVVAPGNTTADKWAQIVDLLPGLLRNPVASPLGKAISDLPGAITSILGLLFPPTPPGGGAGDKGAAGAVSSSDPNQKAGPLGFGTTGYIQEDGMLTYRIDFENDATATAPAQEVDIADQLDSNLDWNTFELTDLGFGDNVISVSEHSQYFQTTVSLTYNSRTFDVQVEAGLDINTGKVFARFLSIDPNTSLPPDVLTGFLPPEDGTGRGMGQISYIVRPKSGLTTGTQIRNVALITFDHGQSIGTNQVNPHDPSQGTDPAKEARNTIDAGAPTSSVNPLPASSPTSFTASWNGADDGGGSGIATFDVFVSIDEGAFTLWRDDATDTSATYTGTASHTYAFYSVATDNVGHVEASPAVGDTSTIIELPPPVVTGTVIQAGLTQRSYVDQIHVDFDREMNLAAVVTNGTIVNAVSLINLGINADAGADQTVPLTAEQFRYEFNSVAGLSRLTWSLDAFAGAKSSLADGFYRLVLNSTLITDTFGKPLDGNGNGTGGDSFVLSFHRLQGDADGNMQVDAADMNQVNAPLGAAPASATWTPNADLDRDGRVTVRDRVLVARATGNQIVPPTSPQELAAALPGDFNIDGIVDAADYVVWRRNLGRTSGTPFSAGDATGDGAVDIADYVVWRQNFGQTRISPQTQPGGPTVSATASVALALAAESPVTLLTAVAAPSASDQNSGPATGGEYRLPALAVARDEVFTALRDSRTVNAESLSTFIRLRRPAIASSIRSFDVEPFAAKLQPDLNLEDILAETRRPVFSESSALAVSGRADTDQGFDEEDTLGGALSACVTDWPELAGMHAKRKSITNWEIS